MIFDHLRFFMHFKTFNLDFLSTGICIYEINFFYLIYCTSTQVNVLFFVRLSIAYLWYSLLHYLQTQSPWQHTIADYLKIPQFLNFSKSHCGSVVQILKSLLGKYLKSLPVALVNVSKLIYFQSFFSKIMNI